MLLLYVLIRVSVDLPLSVLGLNLCSMCLKFLELAHFNSLVTVCACLLRDFCNGQMLLDKQCEHITSKFNVRNVLLTECGVPDDVNDKPGTHSCHSECPSSGQYVICMCNEFQLQKLGLMLFVEMCVILTYLLTNELYNFCILRVR